MQNINEYIKFEIRVDGESHLFRIRKNITLEQITKDVTEKFHKSPASSWGLKLIIKTENQTIKRYVTEANLKDIVDGALVELVPSMQYMLEWIFNETPAEDKFKHLMDLSNDPFVIDEIKRCNYHESIPELCMHVSRMETYRCLSALSRILSFQVVPKFKPIFIEFLTKIVKSNDSSFNLLTTEVSIKLLSQLINIDEYLCELVEEKLEIDDLMPYFWREENTNIQLNTIHLINNLAINSRKYSEKIITDMRSFKNKHFIYKHVIESENARRCTSLAHALYVYQTYILRSYHVLKEQQEDISNDYSDILTEKNEMRPILIEFEEKEARSRRNTATSRNSTISRISSNYSINTQDEDVLIRNKSKSILSLFESVSVTKLTSNCIEYYRRCYLKNFTMSVLEAQYHPGFNIISDQITNILCDLLYIGKDIDKNCNTFIPLIFSNKENKPFFEELFCRAIWLIAKTRREMRAKIDEDHEKVLDVVKEQLNLALKSHPLKFTDIIDKLRETSHNEVFIIWEEERSKKWSRMLQTYPSIQEVKKKLLPQAEQLIRDQRLLVLRNGQYFVKVPEKKGKHLYWFAYLTKNNRKLIFGDYDPKTKKYTSAKSEISIDSIRYVLIGKASKHIRDNRVKRPELVNRCFSLFFNDEVSLDFLATTELIAQYWTDGFHFLLDQATNSDSYTNELNILLRMDLNLHLLELQNIPLPQKPPPIPQLPLECREKPAVPEKTQTLVRRSMARRTQLQNE